MHRVLVPLLVILALSASAFACGPASTPTVTNASALIGGYNQQSISDHFGVQLPGVKYVRHQTTSLSCVDARSDNAILGTRVAHRFHVVEIL